LWQAVQTDQQFLLTADKGFGDIRVHPPGSHASVRMIFTGPKEEELTSDNLVATLAKIVTGETQIEARSWQQAFAGANASLCQVNTLTGEYSREESLKPYKVFWRNATRALKF
jgi:type II secretory pathway component PulL